LPFHILQGILTGGKILLSETLADLENTSQKDIDKEILRAAMIAELDAINIYEQMANLTKNEDVRTILLDIAREEKIHVAMFETVLLQTDEEFLQVYVDYALARK
jgi:rubrerythrin